MTKLYQRLAIHCEPKKTHQHILSYLKRKPIDPYKLWCVLS